MRLSRAYSVFVLSGAVAPLALGTGCFGKTTPERDATGAEGDATTSGGDATSPAGDASVGDDATGPPMDAGVGDGGDAAPCADACVTGAAQCVSGTSIQTCEPSSACPAWGAATTCTPPDATAYVCERFGGPLCVDPSWAEWPIPNASVDSPPAPNLESYANNNDGTVTDNVTGLMWQQAASSSTLMWGSASTPGTAQNHCATLSTAGHDDWRLPSLIELVSLVDWTVTSPSINATYIPGTPANDFWSSTPVAASLAQAWVVLFADGSLSFSREFYSAYVRCVR
jgi:hypothetical protein